MRPHLALPTLLLLAACGPPTTPMGGNTETLSLRRSNGQFRVLAGDADTPTLTAILDRLEANYSRVLSDLSVASLPTVTAKIWSNPTAYYDELERTLGTRYQAAGYVVRGNELRVLVVNNVDVNAVHEFCHVVSMALEPGSPNHPRWLWESVALYVNGEFVDPRTLPYYANGAFPTLAQLSSTVDVSTEIYRVGYLMGEFIVTTFGRDKLIELIHQFGDVPAVLSIPVTEFEQRFAAYVRARPVTPLEANESRAPRNAAADYSMRNERTGSTRLAFTDGMAAPASATMTTVAIAAPHAPRS